MMDNMTVNNNVNTYATETATSTTSKAETSAAADEKSKTKTDEAAVFEKSKDDKKSSTNQIYNRDAVVKRLKADQQNRISSMQGLVEKLLNKQKGTFDLANGTNLAETFRKAAGLASPEDIAKAKADIAEDGYWGVGQTSDRLVSMAIALSGGDTDKAEEMKEAIQKGFKKATKAWGEDLPQICKDTLDTTMKKMDDWKNGVTTAEDYSKYLS
ncbi:hypothetical protein D7V82_12240 [bacterium 1xD8-6]|jgi:hypothetical protein|nr:hypothetical protein D7V72_14600 [bacterium D16-36]RKI68015.1 hypothetical protein D7V82_12240 [bacterium 1xD8-6]